MPTTGLDDLNRCPVASYLGIALSWRLSPWAFREAELHEDVESRCQFGSDHLVDLVFAEVVHAENDRGR
jgi:hypothetical protein